MFIRNINEASALVIITISEFEPLKTLQIVLTLFNCSTWRKNIIRIIWSTKNLSSLIGTTRLELKKMFKIFFKIDLIVEKQRGGRRILTNKSQNEEFAIWNWV